MKHQLAYAVASLFILIGIGTFTYQQLEHWRPLDTIYFSVISFATVGYGDNVPHTDGGKIFTIFYIIFGVSIMLLILSGLGQQWIEHRMGVLDKMESSLTKLKTLNKEGKFTDKIIDTLLYSEKKE